MTINAIREDPLFHHKRVRAAELDIYSLRDLDARKIAEKWRNLLENFKRLYDYNFSCCTTLPPPGPALESSRILSI